MPNDAVPSAPARRTGQDDPRREKAIHPSTASTTTPTQSATQIAYASGMARVAPSSRMNDGMSAEARSPSDRRNEMRNASRRPIMRS